MNGELRIQLMTFLHSMEMFYAKLNCANKASADSNVSILIARTCNQDEYVRVRDRKCQPKIDIIFRSESF